MGKHRTKRSKPSRHKPVKITIHVIAEGHVRVESAIGLEDLHLIEGVWKWRDTGQPAHPVVLALIQAELMHRAGTLPN